MDNRGKPWMIIDQKPTMITSTLEIVPGINTELSKYEITVNGKRLSVENIVRAHDIYRERYEKVLVSNQRLAEIADKATKENKILKSEKETLKSYAFNKERSLTKQLERSNTDRELFTKQMERMYGDVMKQLGDKNKENAKLKEEILKEFELTQINTMKIKRLSNTVYDYDQSVKLFYENDHKSWIPKSTVKLSVMLFKFRSMIKTLREEFDIEGVIDRLREDSDIISLLRDELSAVKKHLVLCKTDHQNELARLQSRHEMLLVECRNAHDSQISKLNDELRRQENEIKSKSIMIGFLTGIKHKFNEVSCERAVWERNCRLLAGKYQILKKNHSDDDYSSEDGSVCKNGKDKEENVVLLKTHLQSNIWVQNKLRNELAVSEQKNDNIKVQLSRRIESQKELEVRNYLLQKEVNDLKLKLKELPGKKHFIEKQTVCVGDKDIRKLIPIKIYFLQSDQKEHFDQKKIYC